MTDNKMQHEDVQARIESLLLEPYFVIDLLPMQVPKEDAARFFAVERYLLSEPNIFIFRKKRADLLLKLNCYYSLMLCIGDDAPYPPEPEELAARIQSGEFLALLTDADDALITVEDDSTCMTVYHPSDRLLALIRSLAAAEGLFVWQPEQTI